MGGTRIPFRGGLTCSCVVTSLPVVERALLEAGLIKHHVDIYQLGYRNDVAASAGTHNGGGCTDVGQYSDACLRVWRDFGWTTQHRTRAQGFSMDHGHGFPYGCPHLAPGARYQASEWAAGRNGLRSRGRVTGPNVQVITWKDALTKHHPEPTGDEIDMADWKRYVRDTPQPLSSDNKYELIKINNAGDVSFATGAAKIIGGYLNLRLTGLAAHKSAYVRIVQDDVDSSTATRVNTGVLTEVLGSSGTTFVTIPVSLNVAKGKSGARRVRAIISTREAGVVLARAEIAYWKA